MDVLLILIVAFLILYGFSYLVAAVVIGFLVSLGRAIVHPIDEG